MLTPEQIERTGHAVASLKSIELREITPEMLQQENFHDLTGAMLCGGASVIGLLKQGGWLVRCRCSRLFRRKTATIVNLSIADSVRDGSDRCEWCYQQFVQWKQDYLATHGKYQSREEEWEWWETH